MSDTITELPAPQVHNNNLMERIRRLEECNYVQQRRINQLFDEFTSFIDFLNDQAEEQGLCEKYDEVMEKANNDILTHFTAHPRVSEQTFTVELEVILRTKRSRDEAENDLHNAFYSSLDFDTANNSGTHNWTHDEDNLAITINTVTVSDAE